MASGQSRPKRDRRARVDSKAQKLAYLASLAKLRLGRRRAETAIVSFHMANIDPDVVATQADAIRRVMPPSADLVQLRTGYGHGRSVDLFLRYVPYDIVVLLDIDCIPIAEASLPTLIAQARAGALVGAAQRANHIANDEHVYAGPFLQALSRETYDRLGRPSFRETPRGDVAEELTYVAEARGVPISFLWPTSCEEPKWPLKDGLVFGRNTIYDDLFLHAFEIREPEQQTAFVATVNRVLARAATP